MATVLAGEVSESDEDREVSTIFSSSSRRPISSAKKAPERAVVILGEASESEEEEILQHVINQAPQTSVSSIQTSRQHHDKPKVRTKAKSYQDIKHKSLLHKKLYERNVQFRRHMVETVKQTCQTAVKDVNTTLHDLMKSQIIVQDISPILRQLTNTLFHLEDKIDIALENCTSLADIHFPMGKWQ